MEVNNHKYFIINKPAGIVSQFVSPHKVKLLGELNYNFPNGTHALGRLDCDSEGLLVLTTNKNMTNLLFNSEQKHKRSYLLLVRNHVNQESILKLQNGVNIKIKDGEYYTTAPCEVKIISKPKELYFNAIDYRESYPHTWLLITLTEGKYHQVRKMVATLHHKCLRLIRTSIGDLALNHLAPGEVKEFKEEEFLKLLFCN